MSVTETQFGPLKCYVANNVPEGHPVQCLVFLSHGFGANGMDLAGFAEALQSVELLGRSCCFVFPEAPLDLGPLGMPGGRAWWEINMARLAEMHQTNDFHQLAKTTPPGLQEATDQLFACIQEAQQKFNVTTARTVIGGFSQGAMISLNLILKHKLVPQSLALFSGTVICESEWRSLASESEGCPVLLSHGTEDQVLPYSQAVVLKELLDGSRFSVTFESFSGGHTIPMPVLTAFASQLANGLQPSK